uniref:TGF_BETA_2 domain-containing protein n=1 Tax=Strongyloides venezuelensis TaxID=75913 RepID=A0A0K0F0Z5_STRVS
MKYYYIIAIIFITFCQTLASSGRWYNDLERNRILQNILTSFGLKKPIFLDIPTENLVGMTRNIENVVEDKEKENKIKKYLQIEPISYNHPIAIFRSDDLIKNSISIKALSLKIEYSVIGDLEEPLSANVLLLLNNNDDENEHLGNFIFDSHNNGNLKKKRYTLQMPLNLTVFKNYISEIGDMMKFLIKFNETPKPVIIKIENVYLEAVVIDNSDRVKRNSDKNCENEDGKSMCCVKKTNINFEEIGWNFIVSPKNFQAQFCHGDCYHSGNNMLIGGVLNKLKHLQDIKYKSCCYPIEYIPLNVSIFKSGLTVETRTLNNLIAKKCTCY